jgi:hypothetical protein
MHTNLYRGRIKLSPNSIGEIQAYIGTSHIVAPRVICGPSRKREEDVNAFVRMRTIPAMRCIDRVSRNESGGRLATDL